MSEDFILREVDISQDAENLAAMWKASDNQWPGTWSGGAEITVDMIREWFKQENNIKVFVCETADQTKIVGYCSFNERTEDRGVGYVGLLNVQPDYQKRSLARRMLCRCVELSVELGFKQMTLHTWPGNLKAVPLYKKTGLYWVPNTSVHMRNFIPGIMVMPCAKSYFAKHDWYRTFKRVLDQKEDDERWEGMKVFTFRWEADGDMLLVRADRESRTLTSVETNAFSAAAIAGNIEPAKGLSTKMRWQLTNKKETPIPVTLIANGTEHLKLDHRNALTIQPGETVELNAEVEIATDAPDIEHGKPVPTIKTMLILDGEVVELATGMQPRPALSVDLEPHHVTLYPGVSKTVHLQLHSYLNDEVKATVSLTPSPGLQTDWTEQTITVGKKNFGGIAVKLTAKQAGVYEMLAVVDFEQGQTRPKRLAIFSLPVGGLLSDMGDPKDTSPETRIENEWTRLLLGRRGGGMQIQAAQSNEPLGFAGESVGPPFWPSELRDKDYEIKLEEKQGQITAILTAHLDDHPGLILRREVTMGAGPLIEIKHAMINKGNTAHRIQIQRGVWPTQRENGTGTLPLADGLVQSRATELPAAPEDIDKKPEGFKEKWVARESQAGTIGIIWGESVVENEVGGWGIDLLSPELDCQPQQWVMMEPLVLYAGPGDWRTVRKHARRLNGQDAVQEPIPVETRAVQNARLEPYPLVTLDDKVKATLVVDNLRRRPLEGKATLLLPEGLSADQEMWTIKEVASKTPLKQEVTLTLPAQASAHKPKIMLETQLADISIKAPVIRLGDRSKVEVEQKDSVWQIDNSRTQFSLASDFSAAMTAWTENGVNHVLSPYPEQKTLGWMSPWYGGLTPLALQNDHEMPGKLADETFAGQVIEDTDARGITWRGVRFSTEIEREQLIGLAVDLDYLTVGQSNVLKLVYTLRNLTTAKRNVGFGWLTFWQPDGDSTHNVVRSAEIERKPTPWGNWSKAGKWGMVTNGESGRTAIMVSPYPEVQLVDWDNAGGHLGIVGKLNVEPMASAQRVCYVALCTNRQEAKRYTWLKDLI